jgi:hypothetical protein
VPPPARANTGPYTPYTQTPPVTSSSAQVVEVRKKQTIPWVPALLVLLLGLSLCGIAAWQSGGFLGLFGGNSTPAPTATVEVAATQPAVQPTSTTAPIVVESAQVPTAEPLATDTPLPPTETPTPPLPTDTPVPIDTPAPEPVPTDTPLPEPPPEPTATTAPVDPPPPEETEGTFSIDGSEFGGGRTGTYHGVTAGWVYGQGTRFNTMSARFNTGGGDPGAGTLTVRGIDSEGAAKMPIMVVVNDVVIFQGDNPLPDDFANAGSGPGNWGLYSWNLPAGTLKPGSNTVTISNLSSSNCTSCPFFVMLDYATISW